MEFDWQSYWEATQDVVANYGLKVLAAIAILIIGKVVIGMITGIIRRALKKTDFDAALSTFLLSLTKIALLTLLFIIILGTLGIQTASFVAVLATAGFAVGFALQGSLSNFASGVMLIIFRPFKAGDYVEAGGTAGVVLDVGIFVTRFKTPDNKLILVPNGQITGGTITNYSAHDTRRVDMVFGIGYGDDIKKAKETLLEIVQSDSRVLKDPAPQVALSELGDSSVNFVVRPWVNTADYWDVFFDTHENVKKVFDERGISIPFPQTDVHLFKENAA